MSGTEAAARSEILRPLQGQLVTLREVAGRLGNGHQTASRWVREGKLPWFHRVGTHWRGHADVSEAWLNGWWSPDVEPWPEFARRHGLTETRYL